MNELKLVIPEKRHENQVQEMVEEFKKSGEEIIYGFAELNTYKDYEDWLDYRQKHQDVATLPPGRVLATTYFLCDEQESKIFGVIDIRHELNDFLEKEGGHIEYAIRPSARNCGLGSYMMALGLEKSLELGIEKVLVTCDLDNVVSKKVIEKNFGELENKIISSEGKTMCRYWICQAKRL